MLLCSRSNRHCGDRAIVTVQQQPNAAYARKTEIRMHSRIWHLYCHIVLFNTHTYALSSGTVGLVHHTHTHTQLSSAEQRITAEWANLPLSPLSSLLSTQLPHYAVLLWDGEWQGAIYIHPYQSECPLNSVKSDKQCNKSSTYINNTGKSLFINIASALL